LTNIHSDSVGCGITNYTGEEIVSCSNFGDENNDLGGKHKIFHYGTKVKMVTLTKVMMK
jgi:hypothetical protein